MWHFQPLVRSEKKSFLLQLSTVSLVLHSIVLASIFFVSSPSKINVVKISSKRLQVRFVPTLDAKKLSSTSKKTSPKTLRASVPSTQTAHKVSSTSSKVNTSKEKVTSSKSIQKSGFTPSSVAGKKTSKKGVSTKPEKSTNTKPHQKDHPSYNFMPQFNEKYSANAQIPSFIAPFTLEKKEKQENKDIKEPAVHTEVGSANQEDIVYVLPNEYSVLMDQQALQQVLQTHWNPPPGMPSEISAQITITIDATGRVASVTFNKPSGILIYDASIEHALEKMVLPSFAYSKTLTITFTP